MRCNSRSILSLLSGVIAIFLTLLYSEFHGYHAKGGVGGGGCWYFRIAKQTTNNFKCKIISVLKLLFLCFHWHSVLNLQRKYYQFNQTKTYLFVRLKTKKMQHQPAKRRNVKTSFRFGRYQSTLPIVWIYLLLTSSTLFYKCTDNEIE